jgi:EmrB/QacA subfamily drug resistance transporter
VAPARTLDPDQVHARRHLILATMCLSLVLIVVSVSSLNVAIPTLSTDLQPTQPELLWIVDAYALVFAGLLLPAGALGDRFGRKGALQVGLAIFGLASIAATFADGPGQLIVLRGVMGAGAAFVMPATLSIIVNVFPPAERAKAIAIWAAFAGAGGAIGPVVSGYLLDHYWWGSVFLANLPFVALALVIGAVIVPTSKDPNHGRLDPIGAVISVAGLLALLFGIIEAPEWGWGDARTIGLFVAAAALLAAFVGWELRSDHPMLDPRVFKLRGLATGSVAISTAFFAMFGMFFVIAPYMQYVLGYSPLAAGVRQLPAAFGMIVMAPRSAQLTARIGRRNAIAIGLTIVAVGLASMALYDEGTSYWAIAVALLVLGIGMGMAMPPSTDAVVSSLPLAKAGVGSAVNDVTREVGGALGIAVVGSVLSSGFRSSIEGSGVALPGPAGESIQAAMKVAGELGPDGGPLARAAELAYADAMPTAILVLVGAMLLGVIVTLVAMPRGRTVAGAAPGDQPLPDATPLDRELLDVEAALLLDRELLDATTPAPPPPAREADGA